MLSVTKRNDGAMLILGKTLYMMVEEIINKDKYKPVKVSEDMED